MSETINLAEDLRETIRVVDNFPKPEISFKDITPVLLQPGLVRRCAAEIGEAFGQLGVTKVVGIESRGFLLGPMVAQELSAGFVIVRKEGKLPRQTSRVSYDLEYGSATIEMHKDALQPGDKVLIHDDLLATGGTAAAAARLAAAQQHLEIVGFSFLVELAFLNGRDVLTHHSPNVHSLIEYDD